MNLPRCVCGENDWLLEQVVNNTVPHIALYLCKNCFRLAQFSNAASLGLFLIPRLMTVLDSAQAEKAREAFLEAWQWAKPPPRKYEVTGMDVYVTDHINATWEKAQTNENA